MTSVEELKEPISELGIVKPELYERILGSQLGAQALENIILSEN